ncbi:uncharacterized protein si:dkey-63d15.12 [Pseudorasbora parva]|uniref:uncharacterized protein si:dkey-63d15.12 n=1 Tax=Pseudorasbora parva TaxID=51549 RepID=UPI00351F7076
MTCTSLSALFATMWFTGLIPGNVTLSVWQKPETIQLKGTNESITCHIKAHSQVQRIVVKWLQNNQTVMKSNSFNVSGAVFINTSLDLQSVCLNHSCMYYCSAQMDLPMLGPVQYGNGTHAYVAFVVPNSTTVTAKPYNEDKVMWSLPLGLGCVLLILSIVCIIYIHYKGHWRVEPKAKKVIVDATHGSPCPERRETVLYAALNIPRDSVKSRNENSAALALTSVTCTEDTVTYSEVHILKRPKDEG